MAHIRKHWQGSSLTVLIFSLLGIVWWKAGTSPTASADPVVPMTDAQRNFVERVLAEVSLDRDALVALNPTQPSAESWLGTVKTWALANQSTIATLSATVDEKTHAVYQIEKAIAIGPYNESHASQLTGARSDLASAKTSYRNGFGSLETSVSQALSAEQRATWTAIKTGHGQDMPYRMLTLSDEQRVSLGDAIRRYKARRAGAPDEAELNAATTEWNNALGQILSAEQLTAITSYQSFLHAAANNVANAWNQTLGGTE